MSKNVHVVHSQGAWKVRLEGSLRASRVFETKRAAVEYGSRIGQIGNANLYIHGTDGRISDCRSFGGSLSHSPKII